ncbi:hypothetical protein HY484_04710 [Candidatus Woesearchaeota archaeon]|nr:hypothetical protein [Candidatus Woesearchaeota archaeon]
MIDKRLKNVELILRVGVFGTFFGHGMLALFVKKSWIPLITAVGFSETTAISLLPLIGIMDILVAVAVLMRPMRFVLVWATLWALATAIIRPVSGEPVWEFVERSSNWAAPLALFILHDLLRKRWQK